MGVRYIGGCCGFEPYHIRAIAEEVRGKYAYQITIQNVKCILKHWMVEGLERGRKGCIRSCHFIITSFLCGLSQREIPHIVIVSGRAVWLELSTRVKRHGWACAMQL